MELDNWSDDAVLQELGSRLTDYRLRQGRTQAELAREAGISKRTLERLEAGQSTQLTNALRVWRALDLLGNLDRLIPEPSLSPVAQLDAQRKVRKRARRTPTENVKPAEWTWGDE